MTLPAGLGSVLVIAKEPRPGRVKTRLTPPFTPAQAAELAAAAIADTLATAALVPAQQHVLVLDGSPAAVRAPGWRTIAQGTGGLDDRLAAAFDQVRGAGPAVLVGMDTPQLEPGQVAAFDPSRYDCCLGPAADGGFWAIGFTDPAIARTVIPGVPMSRDDTGRQQLRRLQAAGLCVQILEELVDVDTAESAALVARAAPESRFGRAWAQMRPIAPPETNPLHGDLRAMSELG